MGIGEQSSTSMALVIHELATNSLKYGALSIDTGLLDISGTMNDGQVSLAWTERGGPAVEPPKEIGYGSKLLDRMVSSQLRGSMKSDWSPEGAVIRLTFDVMKLSS
jgi:two-component sensor histidine kinase